MARFRGIWCTGAGWNGSARCSSLNNKYTTEGGIKVILDSRDSSTAQITPDQNASYLDDTIIMISITKITTNIARQAVSFPLRHHQRVNNPFYFTFSAKKDDRPVERNNQRLSNQVKNEEIREEEASAEEEEFDFQEYEEDESQQTDRPQVYSSEVGSSVRSRLADPAFRKQAIHQFYAFIGKDGPGSKQQ